LVRIAGGPGQQPGSPVFDITSPDGGGQMIAVLADMAVGYSLAQRAETPLKRARRCDRQRIARYGSTQAQIGFARAGVSCRRTERSS
jgi:hypothetical protein